MSEAAPAPARRRTLLQYAVGIDLVIIAIGIALLLPPRSGLVLVPFLAAAGLAATLTRWQVGIATTAFSLLALLTFVDSSVPPRQLLLFVAGGLGASALLGTERARPEAPEAAADDAVMRAQLTELWTRSRARIVPLLMHVGLPLLVGVLYLNISTVLVEKYGIPSVLQPLILLLCGLVLLCWNDFRPASVLLMPATLALTAYVLVVFTSSSWARDGATADVDVADLAKSLMLLFVVASLTASWSSLRRALLILAASAALISAVVLVQVAIGDPDLQFGGFAKLDQGHIYGEVKELRPAGPIGDANYLARILILGFTAAVFIGAERRRRERVWSAAASLLIALGILFTYSRGGMLTLAAVVLLMVLMRHVRVTKTSVAAACVLVLALLPTDVGKRLLTLESVIANENDLSEIDPSADKRRHLILAGLHMFADHPLLGVGAGNFGNRYPAYANLVGSNSIDFTPMGLRQFPHNLYLEVATETGLVGLVAFCTAMIVTLLALYRARRTLLARGEDDRAALVTAIAVGIAGYLAASLFLHSGWPRYLWLFLGFAVAAIRLTHGPREEAL